MSINKKLMLFAAVLVVVPMLILSVVSNMVLDSQIEESAQNYLKNTLIIARNSMLNRLEEMKISCRFTGQTSSFQNYLANRDLNGLEAEARKLKESCSYLDFIMILDENGQCLSKLPSSATRFPSALKEIVSNAGKSKEQLVSETSFNLDELFTPGTAEYNQFRVTVSSGKEDQKYMDKCLTGVAVTPVYRDQDKNELLGYLLVGDIANNDSYFPEIYTMDVKDSFLAISVDDIRVTSNIRSPKKADFIGSPTPVTMETLEGLKNSYFGYVDIDGERHVFLDEPITDYRGEAVGVLGVGIPWHNFVSLLHTNDYLILWVTFLCLVVMLYIGHGLSLKITRPIIQATKMAEGIARGEHDFNVDKTLLKGNSETDILLKTYLKMARDLEKSEQERNKVLNELEEKVESRTYDLKQAVQSLKKADKVKSQFLANMSHELRTPLTSIIDTAQVLLDKIAGPLNSKQEGYLRNMLHSGQHLLQLINDILDISKIEAEMMRLSLSTFYVKDVVENSFTVVKSSAYWKDMNLVAKIEPENFQVKADERKVKQILYNLLSNAVKFTPENGKVSLEVYHREPFMQVVVRDNGIGIKEEDQERVFEAFEQVDSSYGRQYEGTGLGLPLTKRLVELHGGDLYLHSKEGEGTEIILTIPLDTEEFLAGKRYKAMEG